MTKHELMENFTMEELAEMVIERDMNRQDEINKLKNQLDRKQTEIDQIDEILEKLFGVKHDVVSKPTEFEKILQEKADGYKSLTDFLPAEPIKVADALIDAEIEPKAIEDGLEVVYNKRHFEISELRQTAEHLLVYCNGNESEEEK